MKFSIITATYNSAAYVHNTIDSVKTQTDTQFEHIFIDGQSTDATMDILRAYQAEYPDTVRIISAEPNGIADAMNRGIQEAAGEWIMHLHSDDSFVDDAVLADMRHLINQHPDIRWWYGKANFINTETGSSRVIPHRSAYHSVRTWLLLLTNYIPHQSVFLHKSVFEQHGMFLPQYRSSMDYELWIRLAKAGVPARFSHRLVCNFSVRPDAQTQVGKHRMENLQVFEEHVSNPFIRALLKQVYTVHAKRSLF